jgi:hypothetical protein
MILQCESKSKKFKIERDSAAGVGASGQGN